MCTTTCQTARWSFCRCECDGANHGALSPFGRLVPLFPWPTGRKNRERSAPSAMLSPDARSAPTIDAEPTTRGET